MGVKPLLLATGTLYCLLHEVDASGPVVNGRKVEYIVRCAGVTPGEEHRRDTRVDVGEGLNKRLRVSGWKPPRCCLNRGEVVAGFVRFCMGCVECTWRWFWLAFVFPQ